MKVSPRSPEAVSVALAVLIAGILNVPFWRLLYSSVAPRTSFEWLFIAATFLSILLVTYLAVLLLAVRPVFRPLFAVLLPLSAAASYFMLEYGVVIDVNMVRNVFETNSAEAADLVSTKMIAYIAALGLLPAVLLWRTPIAWPSFKDEVMLKARAAAITLPLAAVALFPFFSNVTSVFREHRELRLTLTPVNYIGALNKYVRSKFKRPARALEAIAPDAARDPAAAARTKKSLFVIVVGETARADHFGLNGYAKPTTPELAKIPGLINFPEVTSCGTDTAQSVPCMFSGLGRTAFSNAKAEGRENLLDVLKRAGIDVVWRENQSGCKGVCDRIKTEVLTGLKHPTFYAYSENHDEILLDGLPERLNSLTQDTVIVMHMMGSHGPAYWKRYPARFEVFTPVCRESQFSRCTNEELVNTYDNTILYGDYVLSRLIGILKDAADQGTAETGMVYVSDHGESLGENNIYLHGMPYSLAPRAQVHVPMIAWLSQPFAASARLDLACLAKAARDPASHDNLFHSVLGILDVRTSARNETLDLFHPCRPNASASESRLQ